MQSRSKQKQNTWDHLAWTVENAKIQCTRWGSHARGVHLTHDTSRENSKGEARGRADRRIIEKSSVKYRLKERGHYKGRKSQTRPN